MSSPSSSKTLTLGVTLTNIMCENLDSVAEAIVSGVILIYHQNSLVISKKYTHCQGLQ